MLPKNVYMKLSKKDKQKVKSNLIRGSGAYSQKKQPFGYYGAKIGKALGSTFYGAPGGYLGEKVGGYLSNKVGKIFGSGDYINSRGKYIPSYPGVHKMFKSVRGSGAYYDMPKTVSTNATSPPSFGSNRTIVRHREFIGNIQGSTGFTINYWNVNPGDETTFPWLSTLAANYEKYRPIGIIFEFKSTSANALNSTNTALGTVMMAPRYNAISQSLPQSKMEMLQIENCISICPAESAMCGIECAKNYNPLGVLYNRNQTQVVSGSEQLYDFADFYLATEGMQAVATIGELWVTYEIELLTPILSGGQVGDTINFANYTLSSSVTTSAFFAGASSSLNVSNMTLTFGSTTCTFPSNLTTGIYQVTYAVVGTSAACSAPTLTPTTNCALTSIYIGNTLSRLHSSGTITTAVLVCVWCIEITGASAVITLSGGTLPTSPSSGQFIVQQLPGAIGE